jgi:hypothetical protein
MKTYKASELIAGLVKFIEKHGDKNVWVYDNNCHGNYGCEPWTPLDKEDGVTPFQLEDGEVVARLETQW